MMNMKKQYVYIVRYGVTEFPLVENQGPYDSDIDPKVTHALDIARRIAESTAESERPRHVYTSPFLRCVHTGSIICQGLSSSKGKTLRIEDGLTEWKQPSLLVEPNGTRTYPKTVETHAQTFPSVIDTDYKSLNPVPNDDHWETEEALYERCGKTMAALLEVEKDHNFAIVAHAPCDIALTLYMEGKTLKESTLPALPLGGITRFCRNVHDDGSFGDWTLEFFGDTEHMPGEYKTGLKRWTLPSLT